MIPLNQRHPYAGVWPVWDQGLPVLDAYAALRGIHAFTKWSDVEHQQGQYSFTRLDDRIAKRLQGRTDLGITIEFLVHWPDWLWNHVARSTDNSQNPQFWDPIYLDLYKELIHALAQHIETAPYRPQVVLIRAHWVARNTESCRPYQTDWDNYTPTPTGHVYQHNYTNAQGDKYCEAILQTYLNTFKPLDIMVAAKPSTATWWKYQRADNWAALGAHFHATSGKPNVRAQIEATRVTRAGLARAYSEPGHSAWKRPGWEPQCFYWQALSDLYRGVEFVAFYGADIANQPAEGVLDFVHRYAGYLREPAQAPGAWIAFRGMENPNKWGLFLEGDFRFLINHLNPHESTALYSKPGPDHTDYSQMSPTQLTNPCTEPITDLGPDKYGLWARRTTQSPILLTLDPDFAASLVSPIQLNITYYDLNHNSFQVILADPDGQPQAFTVQKADTGLWQTAPITPLTYRFQRDLDNADIQLMSQDGDTIFHMVEIIRRQNAPLPPDTPVTITLSIANPNGELIATVTLQGVKN